MTVFMNTDYAVVFETQQQTIQYERDEVVARVRRTGRGGDADCVVLMTSAAGSILSGDRAIIMIHPPPTPFIPLSPNPSQKQMHSSVVFVCWEIWTDYIPTEHCVTAIQGLHI
jgi:hypothetical protein